MASYTRLKAMLSDLGMPVIDKGNLPAGVSYAVPLTGAGTPEAAVTAPVGSMYLRTDGGANTTLYVKETGTGNTGWAAK
jgi:hypothetical protein